MRVRGAVVLAVVLGAAMAGPAGLTAASATNSPEWQRVSSPNPAGASGNFLRSVSCLSSTRCFAVGDTTNRALVLGLSGGHWRRVQATVRGANPRLNAVSCTAAFCLTVGGSDSGFAALRYAGTQWTRTQPVQVGPVTGTSSLNAVSCVSAAQCWVAGQASSGGGYVPLFEHYRDGRWSRIKVTDPGHFGVLDGISCVSAADCWAVGQSWSDASTAGLPLTAHWNGHAWRAVSSPHLGHNSELFGVSCMASNDCYAAGNTATPPNTLAGQPFVEHYDGRSWSFAVRWKTYKQGVNLNGISCSSRTRCAAVGDEIADSSGDVVNFVLERGAHGWRQATAAQPATQPTLVGVTCTASTSSACFAVGAFSPHNSAATATMILRRS